MIAVTVSQHCKHAAMHEILFIGFCIAFVINALLFACLLG